MTPWSIAAMLLVAAVAWRSRPRAGRRRVAPAVDGPLRSGRRPPIVIAVPVASTLVVAVVAPELAVLSIAGWAAWRAARPRLDASRRRRRVDHDLPDAIDLLVLIVRAGLSPAEAVRTVVDVVTPPIRDGFTEVVHRLDRGQPFDDAVRALSDTLGPAAHGLVDVITTTTRYGLPLEPVLDQLTDEARAARRRRHQAAARKLPIRLSFPLVACTLPSFVLLAIAPAVIAALSSLGTSAW